MAECTFGIDHDVLKVIGLVVFGLSVLAYVYFKGNL